MRTAIKLFFYFAIFLPLPLLSEQWQLFMLMCGIPAYCVIYLMLFVERRD